MNNYINKPTAALVTALNSIIQGRSDLRDNAEISEAFSSFKRTSETPPAIVGYIRQKTDPASASAGFTKEQLELLMFAVIARSSSTYGTIPGVVAHLALIGEHDAAATIAANAANETGDRNHTPHPTMLYDSYKILGDSLNVRYPTPASYHLTRHIIQGRTKLGSNELDSVEAVESYLKTENLHVPPYTTEDITTALYFCHLIRPETIQYHTQILQTESRMNDTGSAHYERNPYDKQWLATRMLELAVREASSVDEYDTGKLSYIGAWELLVNQLVGHIPQQQHSKLLAWVHAHNDEETGQAIGWDGAAEVGHAEDARLHAVRIMESLDAPTFASVLNEITALNQSRLDFWQSKKKNIPAKKFHYEAR